VLVAVRDLDAAAAEFESVHGLRASPGGSHPGWGTANRIVPLGESYIELIAVVDTDAAAPTALGRWVMRYASDGGRPLGWAVRTADLDGVAARLGLAVHPGSRTLPGGEALRWRTAGLEAAASEPALPFFIEWEPGAPFPGRAPVRHPAGAVSLSCVVLSGDADRLATWLGEDAVPMTVLPGEPAVAGVLVTGPSGEIVVGSRT
jgi:hypothetical protein